MVQVALRNERVWCGRCLHEDPYERLTWSISAFRTCWRHGLELSTACSQCGRSHRARDVVGTGTHCPHCGATLPAGSPGMDPMDEQLRELFMWLARGNTFHVRPFVRGLRVVVGSVTELARPFDQGLLVAKLLASASLRFEEVAWILVCSGRSIEELLVLGAGPAGEPARARRLARRARIEAAIRAEIAAPIASRRSFAQFSRDHGVATVTLHRDCPELVAALLSSANDRRTLTLRARVMQRRAGLNLARREHQPAAWI